MSKTPAAGINDQADDMTPDELEALARRAGAAAGDNEDAASAAAAEDEAPGAAAGQTPPSDGTPPADAAAGTEEEEAPAAAVPEAPRLLEVPDIASLTEQRKAISAKRAQVEEQWEQGAITDEQRAEQLDAIDSELFDLASRAGSAQALAEFNRQQIAAQQMAKLDELRAAGAKAGLDYSNADVADDFDAMMQRLAQRPEYAGKDFSALADEAHRRVMVLHGKLEAAAEPPPAAAAPAARPNPRAAALPVLSSLPPAGQPAVGNTLVEELAAIDDPDALEARIAAMSPQQRAQLTRSTMPV